jgi:RNA polymerase sigma-70 factor (ECF subfamily)
LGCRPEWSKRLNPDRSIKDITVDREAEACVTDRDRRVSILCVHGLWRKISVATNGRLSTDAATSDEALMRQLAAGRQEALGPLHARYAALIYGVAAQSLDRAAAEEISQDVFLAVWRHSATFDAARGTFRAWVLQITRASVLNELRRRSRRPRTATESNGSGGDHLRDPGPDPAESAWRKHRRAAVRAAVDALPRRQREALSLAFLEDLTHEQVAAFLNLPLGTTKSRIRSGLKALRGTLAPLAGAGLLVAGLLAIAGLREHSHQAALRRQQRALALVTRSDVVPRRLGPAPGTNSQAHGNYRGRPGVDLAVLTVSYFAPAPSGFEYRAWVSHGGQWTLLGRVQLDAEGRGLIIAEGAVLVAPPDALQVTLEPVGNRTDARSTPTGRPVVHWPVP